MESMGLAAPRRKTKYDIDPRNNAWANDDNKFGQKLMEKFGWAKGKGLGAQEDGETENIKVKVKNDKHGIGANNDYSDTWLDHQDDFNSILASLNTCHSAPGSGTATPTNEESTEAVVGSMEERSKSSKSRVHYKKFTRSKDLTRADANDLDALFGRRKKFEKRSRKLQKAAKSEPASPFAGMSPLGTTPAGGNSPRTEDESAAGDVKVEANDSSDKEYDAAGNLRTVTSTMSVSDYFAKKMAEIKAKRSGATPTAVDAYCDNSIRQIKEEIKEEKTEVEEAEEKPEVYRQEKFQPAALSVQQYFEQKMKEKKARAEAAAVVKQEVEENNNNADAQVEDSVAENDETVKKEKKKKKKKKEKNREEKESKSEETSDAQSDTVEKPKKNKKKKVKENLDSAEASVTTPPVEAVKEAETTRAGEAIAEKKDKKRKRKLECDESEKQESGHSVEPEVVKKKKKKKTKSLEDPSPAVKEESGIVKETEVKSEEMPSDGTALKKKKKKKKNSECANVC